MREICPPLTRFLHSTIKVRHSSKFIRFGNLFTIFAEYDMTKAEELQNKVNAFSEPPAYRAHESVESGNIYEEVKHDVNSAANTYMYDVAKPFEEDNSPGEKEGDYEKLNDGAGYEYVEQRDLGSPVSHMYVNKTEV